MANRTDLCVHLVWATTRRLPLITTDVKPRLYAQMAQRCRQLSCVPLAIGGMPDHVHLLVDLHPTVTVALLMKDVKGASSVFMRTLLAPGSFFQWQTGYAAFSVSKRSLPRLQDYIASQEQHHAHGTTISGAEPPSVF